MNIEIIDKIILQLYRKMTTEIIPEFKKNHIVSNRLNARKIDFLSN